jgi:pseudaminic acid biosynthesis-associated methylase
MTSEQATTKQVKVWQGEFGRAYTDRNTFALDEYNQLYLRRYGASQDELNRRWWKDVPKDARILEVGANVGYQLEALRRIGYRNLFGIEIQRYCVEKAKTLHPHVDIIQAEGADIPFKADWFDVVYTSGVLIHIAPKDLPAVQAEMYRVTRRWIFGLEYYAPELVEIPYHGHEQLLWKGDYAGLFKSRFRVLQSVNEELIEYRDDPGKIDQFYLIEKK